MMDELEIKSNKSNNIDNQPLIIQNHIQATEPDLSNSKFPQAI